jgi:hypothetical protein
MTEPDLTGTDRQTLDAAQDAAMDPDSNAEPEFQATPPVRLNRSQNDEDDDGQDPEVSPTASR